MGQDSDGGWDRTVMVGQDRTVMVGETELLTLHSVQLAHLLMCGRG